MNVHESDSRLLHAVYQRIPLTTGLTAVAVPFFASQMWTVFPTRVMQIWVAAFCVNLVFCLVLCICYLRLGKEQVWHGKTLTKWRAGLTAILVVAAISWGIGPALLIPTATGVQLALLLCSVMIACAVSVNSFSEYLLGILIYLAVALLLPASAAWLSAITTGNNAMFLIALVLVAAFGALAMVSKSANSAIRERFDSELHLKKALLQASEAQQVAEAASAAKTQFLATMSHELRTPLNAVIGGAQLLRVEQSGSLQQVKHIDAIEQSGSHLLGLIENILDLSRAESGELPLHFENFDFAQCIHSAVSIAKLSARSKGLVIVCHVDPEMPTWRRGDRKRISQVVLNLLGNAVKFTAEGQVSVRVTPSLHVGCNGVIISIKDSGVGISAHELPYIFEKFRQADQGSNRRFGGSGLGLAIVKLWVQAMGASVSATSRLGEGSEFVIEMPLALGESPPPKLSALAQDTPKSFESSRHILVVEDDPMNQAVVCGLLRHAGHRISVASNGAEALVFMAKLTDLDLVLMDWQMPDMDGLEVTRRMRNGLSGELGKSVPIVALTANAFAQDRAQCIAAGMNDFLTKPVLRADLLATINRWAIDRSQSEKMPHQIVFDATALDELSKASVDGEPDFGQEMLALFLTSLGPALATIKIALETAEMKDLQRAVHSLKSSSASVGGVELSKLSAKHEADLRQGLAPESTLVTEFAVAIERFEKAVHSELVTLAGLERFH
jgi:signal transduction histidine kinase/DNA-binding response OmpR family regulator